MALCIWLETERDGAFVRLKQAATAVALGRVLPQKWNGPSTWCRNPKWRNKMVHPRSHPTRVAGARVAHAGHL